MIWDNERVELLKKLWAEGLSASQIAGRIGDVTRNAVIGKVHRLGLSGRITTSRVRKARKVERQRQERDERGQFSAMVRAINEARREALAAVPASTVSEAPKPVVPAVVPPFEDEEELVRVTLGVSLLDLKESMCRYPIGDPQEHGFHFCGAPRAAGLPYCEKHVRVCLQPVQRRSKPARPVRLSNELKVLELEAETL